MTGWGCVPLILGCCWLAVMTPSQHLSLPCLPLTCFKNNYSVSMHADISILQLVLQLLAKFSHPFLMILLCAHISSKCQVVIAQLFQLGRGKAQSEQWRSLNKVCAWEGRETGMDREKKQDERKLTKWFTVIGGDIFVAFVFFCMHLLVFWKPVFFNKENTTHEYYFFQIRKNHNEPARVP